MSHFAVYVFGHDIDGQLAPFHEFWPPKLVNNSWTDTLLWIIDARRESAGVTMVAAT